MGAKPLYRSTSEAAEAAEGGAWRGRHCGVGEGVPTGSA